MAKFVAVLSLFTLAQGANQSTEHSVPLSTRLDCAVLPKYNLDQGTAGPFRLKAADCDLADASRGACSFLRSPSSINVYTNASDKNPVTFVNNYEKGFYPGWFRCVNPPAGSPLDTLPSLQIKVPTKIGINPMPEEWKTVRVVNNADSARMVWGESDDTPTLPLGMYHDYSYGRKIAGINVGAHNFTRWAVDKSGNATSLPAHKKYASVRLLSKDSEIHRKHGEFTTLLRIEGTEEDWKAGH
ncbi:hypothetical protein N7474_002475 [Penicillium riverlandense]|uniref:uncharacterized protein n=1 Tax=Penicillium riverlandense TaxID=1903569 RepID=UPI002549A2FF|nr:uncharacterized protein N7474_002475 [Penicillium riverlandense]KAJ5825337.1 hypothetical protein N7474_002475 [Penicillium riverlandense]